MQISSWAASQEITRFHGTQRVITAFTTIRHLSLSWASPIQSTYPHPTSRRSILILSTHLRSTPRSPQWSHSLRFPNQDPVHPPLLTHTSHMPSPSHSSRFYHPHKLRSDLLKIINMPEEANNCSIPGKNMRHRSTNICMVHVQHSNSVRIDQHFLGGKLSTARRCHVSSI